MIQKVLGEEKSFKKDKFVYTPELIRLPEYRGLGGRGMQHEERILCNKLELSTSIQPSPISLHKHILFSYYFLLFSHGSISHFPNAF